MPGIILLSLHTENISVLNSNNFSVLLDVKSSGNIYQLHIYCTELQISSNKNF